MKQRNERKKTEGGRLNPEFKKKVSGPKEKGWKVKRHGTGATRFSPPLAGTLCQRARQPPGCSQTPTSRLFSGATC